jgi:hypothetical protein
VLHWEHKVEQGDIQQTERSRKMKRNPSKRENSRKTADYPHQGDKVMESPKRPLLGVVLISGSYCVGVAALIVAMFLNRDVVGVQIANVHGVPALAGLPILILTCIVGTLVAIGLYKMTSWGYWLTLVYASYLLIGPPLLVGKDASLFANLTWPLTMVIYLVLRKKKYFGTHQSP